MEQQGRRFVRLVFLTAIVGMTVTAAMAANDLTLMRNTLDKMGILALLKELNACGAPQKLDRGIR